MKGRKLSRRDILQGAATLAAGAVFASPVRAQAPEPVAITPDLVEAAKKEGKLILYSSMDLPVGEKLGKAFEAAYPGITDPDRALRFGAAIPADRPGIRVQTSAPPT